MLDLHRLVDLLVSLVVFKSVVTGLIFVFFFFNDTATTEIYTLSLHDALPISSTLFCAITVPPGLQNGRVSSARAFIRASALASTDRKSTRLNSSHTDISRMPSSA